MAIFRRGHNDHKVFDSRHIRIVEHGFKSSDAGNCSIRVKSAILSRLQQDLPPSLIAFCQKSSRPYLSSHSVCLSVCVCVQLSHPTFFPPLYNVLNHTNLIFSEIYRVFFSLGLPLKSLGMENQG